MGQTCDPKQCVLPNCRCVDTTPPGGIKVGDVPQIVMVTFENSITIANVDQYRTLFNINNPNGCPIRGTFFIEDEGTDYTLVKTLYDEGHEIGINSVDGTLPTDDTAWIDMYRSVKIKLINNGIADPDILGTRAPELAPGGSDQLIGLGNNGLLYDSSCARTGWSDKDTLVWPFTFDYPTPACDNGDAPSFPFNGYWEVPIADLHDLSSERLPCATPSACRNITTKADAFNLFFTAFVDHYNGNRAPMLMIIDPQWAANNDLLQGTIEFLDYIRAAFPAETWIVPVRKALSWVQDPVPIANTTSFAPWGCN